MDFLSHFWSNDSVYSLVLLVLTLIDTNNSIVNRSLRRGGIKLIQIDLMTDKRVLLFLLVLFITASFSLRLFHWARSTIAPCPLTRCYSWYFDFLLRWIHLGVFASDALGSACWSYKSLILRRQFLLLQQFVPSVKIFVVNYHEIWIFNHFMRRLVVPVVLVLPRLSLSDLLIILECYRLNRHFTRSWRLASWVDLFGLPNSRCSLLLTLLYRIGILALVSVGLLTYEERVFCSLPIGFIACCLVHAQHVILLSNGVRGHILLL